MLRTRMAIIAAGVLVIAQSAVGVSHAAPTSANPAANSSQATVDRHAIHQVGQLPHIGLPAQAQAPTSSHTARTPSLATDATLGVLEHAPARETTKPAPTPANRSTTTRPTSVGLPAGPPYSVFIADGGSSYFAAPTYPFFGGGYPPAQVNGAGSSFSFYLAGPDGTAPLAGTTYNDVPTGVAPVPGEPVLGLSYLLDDGSTAEPVGTATVTLDTYTTDAPGNTTSLSASWVVDLSGGGSVSGQLLFNVASLGTIDALALASGTSFGDGLGVGVPQESSISVENVGTESISIGSASAGGIDAADLTVDGSDCPASLAPGDQCMFSLTYDANAAGVRHMALDIVAGVEPGFVHLDIAATAYNTVTASVTGPGSIQFAINGTSQGSCTPDLSSCLLILFGDMTVTEQAVTGDAFLGWNGDCTGFGTCTLSPAAPHTIGATFGASITAPPPAVQASQGHYGFDDQTSGCTTRPCSPPPDPGIAVSPTEVVEGVSGAVGLYTRDGSVGVGVAAADFFADPTVTDPKSDVRILWDQADQRWFATNSGWDCDNGYIDLAASSTSDALAGWVVYRVVLPHSKPVQVRLGRSSDKLIVSTGVQSSAPGCLGEVPLPPSVLVFDLSQVDAGGASVSETVVPIDGETAPIPLADGTHSAALIITTGQLPIGGTHPVVITISGQDATDSISSDTVVVSATRPLDSGVTDAVWGAGHVWVTAWDDCAEEPFSHCLRADEIDLSNASDPSVIDSFDVDAGGADDPQDWLAVAGDGSLFLSYSRRASNMSETVVVTHPAGAAPGTHGEPVVVAEGPANPLFGSLSSSFAAAPDPVDPHLIWQDSQVDTGDNGWLTWLSAVRADAPGAPTGSAVLDNGATATDYLRVELTPSVGAGSGATLMRISDDPEMAGFIETGIAVGWSHQLDDTVIGGTKATGPRRVYISWGDGVGDWSAPIASSPITVDASVPSTRLAGPDRYGTAAAISRSTFGPGADTVYIASGLGFADALAGAAVAARDGSPLLFVNSTIPAATATELGRLQPRQIIILGGSASVSASVATALQPFASVDVTRLSGPDRYGTAAAISAASFAPGVPYVFLAQGNDWPDALAAAPVAGVFGSPILFVSKSTIPSATAAELARLKPSAIIVLGGPAVVADSVLSGLAAYAPAPDVFRIFGATRYTTAADLAEVFGYQADEVFLASGLNYPDALAGAAVAGTTGSAILYVSGILPADTTYELNRLQPKQLFFLGGTGSISASVAAAADHYLGP